MGDEGGTSLYSGGHRIPVFQRNGFSEDRNLTINITEFNDKIHIKLRDPNEYAFNYAEDIDLGDFEVLRENQSLDINYSEFKLNLVELLQQFQKREMFVKCQLKDRKCTLIFYNKSKIKSIIYLTLDLHLTDQKEIILEMVQEMQLIQEANTRLKKQVVHANKVLVDKDKEIKDLCTAKKSVEEYFISNLKDIEQLNSLKLQDIQNNISSKIGKFTNRLTLLENHILILKQENYLKSDSSGRLMKTLENLRLENLENATTIEELKKENCSLNTLRFNLEKSIADLKKSLEDNELLNKELNRKKSELEQDLSQMSIIVTQKQNTIDELSKDLVQANGMLVNFNKHYDNKVKEVQELVEELTVKEKCILEHQARLNQVLQTYDAYRTNFNSDTFENQKKEISVANAKIRELEDEMRKLNKINTLLTQKVSNAAGLFPKK